MNIIIWEIDDKLQEHNHIGGIGQKGEEKCEEFIARNQEYNRGGERYEIDFFLSKICFKWDMTDAEFRDIHNATPDDYADDMTEYEGAVFFGNFKLEFIKNNIAGCYCNLFQYGATDENGEAYEHLEDGTPYEELYPICDEIRVPHRRTFTAFAEKVEHQVINLLNNHPEFIKEAIKPTEPSKWYPGEREKYMKDFSREA